MLTTDPQFEGISIAIEGTLPAVLASEASLTQCISNLLSNALKFVVPGTPPRVRIYAEELEQDVRLWIEDNGIGIDARDQERIWTVFTRVVPTQNYPGSGIGLSIVRKAIERMNGTLGVESSLGQGSKFWLRLKRP